METPTLEGQLAELGVHGAEPEPGFVDPVNTWTRGVRWGRRRKAVSIASTALCVAVLGAVGWAVPATSPSVLEPVPTSGGHDAATIPSVLWDTPSRAPAVAWGAPVVAAQEAQRAGWFGSDLAVAVRTGDGRQGFVPAPDYAGGVSISPDGRRIAYWTTGETSGTPNTSFGQEQTVTGLAVRDVVDGSLLTHHYEAPHGVSTRTLYWADDTFLVADAGEWIAGDDGEDMARGSSSSEGGLVWDVDQPSPTPWEELFGEAEVPDRNFSWARDGVVVTTGFSRETGGAEVTPVEVYDLRAGAVRSSATVTGATAQSSAGLPNILVGPDERVFLVGDLRRAQNPNSVTVVPGANATAGGEVSVLTDSDGTVGFYGLRGDDLLASTTYEGAPEDGDGRLDVVAMSMQGDERTRTLLVDVRGDGSGEHGSWAWATELLETAPVAEGTEPESATSPWWWVGGGLAATAAVLVVWIGWWRRARP